MDRAEGALRVAELALAEARRALQAIAEIRVIEGPKGERGEQGERGLDGKLSAVGEWEDRVYRDSDVVTFGGSLYQAERDTGKPPSHTDWRCIVPAGSDGIDGRSLNLRATWSPTETYARLDVVSLDGGVFMARRDNPGPCPGDGWMLGVQRGKAGIKGERGEPGAKGDRGSPAPRIVDISLDATGLVVLTYDDGATLERDWAPALAQIAR